MNGGRGSTYRLLWASDRINVLTVTRWKSPLKMLSLLLTICWWLVPAPWKPPKFLEVSFRQPPPCPLSQHSSSVKSCQSLSYPNVSRGSLTQSKRWHLYLLSHSIGQNQVIASAMLEKMVSVRLTCWECSSSTVYSLTEMDYSWCTMSWRTEWENLGVVG